MISQGEVTLAHSFISWYVLVTLVTSSLYYLFQWLGNLLLDKLGACPCIDVETWTKKDEVTYVKAHLTSKQQEQSRCHGQCGEG